MNHHGNHSCRSTWNAVTSLFAAATLLVPASLSFATVQPIVGCTNSQLSATINLSAVTNYGHYGGSGTIMDEGYIAEYSDAVPLLANQSGYSGVDIYGGRVRTQFDTTNSMLNILNYALAASAATAIAVAFTPTNAGVFSASVTCIGGGDAHVTVQGSGVLEPALGGLVLWLLFGHPRRSLHAAGRHRIWQMLTLPRAGAAVPPRAPAPRRLPACPAQV